MFVRGMVTRTNLHISLEYSVIFSCYFNPSKADANFVQSTRVQRILKII